MPELSTASAPELIRPDQLPDVLSHPDVQSLPFGDREKVFEQGVGEAADWVTQNGGWTPEMYRGFGDAVGKLRSDLQGSETMTEKVKSGAEDFGHMALGLARAGEGALFDASPRTADGQWRMPFSEVAPMLNEGFNKLGSAIDTGVSAINRDKEGAALEEGLKKFRGKLDSGEFFSAPDGVTEWMKREESELLPLRKNYYHAAEYYEPEQSAQDFAQSNGLHAPRNAALVAEYLRTRSPQAWKALRNNLIQLPKHAAADEAQRQIAEKSDTVKRMNTTLTGSTGTGGESVGEESMRSAADPINAMSLVAPFLRASKAGTPMFAQMFKGMAEAQFLGALGLAVQQPGSQADDYWENAKHMFAGALGMEIAGLGVRGVRELRSKGEATPEVTSVEVDSSGQEAASKPAETTPATDTVASELFNNTGKEGATDADFAGLDAKVDATQGAEPTPESAARFAESTPETPPVEATPVAPPEPPPVKYRTFDAHGRLKASKEAPHAEAMKEMRGRESMLQRVLDCLSKKLAS